MTRSLPLRRIDGRRDHGTATSRTQGRQTRKETRTRRRETRRRVRCRHRRLLLRCVCPLRFRTSNSYSDNNSVPGRWQINQRTGGGWNRRREDGTGDCGGPEGQGESGRVRGPRSVSGSRRSYRRDTRSAAGRVATRRRAFAAPTRGGLLPLVRSRHASPRPALSLSLLLLRCVTFRSVTFQRCSATTLHPRNFPPLPRVSSRRHPRRRPALSSHRSARSPIEPTRLALLALVCGLPPLPEYGLGRPEWDQVLRRLGLVRTRWTCRRTRRVRHSGTPPGVFSTTTDGVAACFTGSPS